MLPDRESEGLASLFDAAPYQVLSLTELEKRRQMIAEYMDKLDAEIIRRQLRGKA